MKAMKKLMAVGLTLAMIITSIAVLPVFAAEAEQTVPTPSYDWYLNAEAGTTNYTIETINDLAGLANIVNGTATKEDGTEIPVDTFSRKTIAFGTADLDIDMVDVDWTPIGRNRETNNFAGTFDGNGVTFSNLTIDTPETDFVGLFGYAWDGNFKNITMENPNITGGSYVGSIVGAMVGDVTNCNVIGDEPTGEDENKTYYSNLTGNHYVGGAVGWGYVDYENCHVTNTKVYVRPYGTQSVLDYGDKGGGLAGFMGEGNFKVDNCTADNVSVIAFRDAGGLFGITTGSPSNTVTFNDCSVTNSYIYADGSFFIPGIMQYASGGFIGRALAKVLFTGTNIISNNDVDALTAGHVGLVCGSPSTDEFEPINDSTN